MNVIFITSDHHRWDFLSTVGGPVETPCLDQLAARGTRLNKAYCQTPLCVPGRIAMTTGRYPMNTGYFTNRHPIDPAEPSFVRELRQSGIHTAMIGKLHHHVHVFEADYTRHEADIHALGYDYVHETSGKQGSGAIACECRYAEFLRGKGLLEAYRKWTGRWGEEGTRAHFSDPWPWDPSTTQDAYICQQAKSFLQRQPRDRPFYLHLGFVGPHPPFDAPEQFRKTDEGMHAGHPREKPAVNPQWWPAYLACIREVDHYVGEVLATLRDLGMEEDTLVLYTSDHGDLAGEQGLWGKLYFYEGSVHVPFIAAGPGVQAGVVSDALVELIDVGGTFCDFFQVETHHWDQGQSLLPLLRGETATHRESVFAEMGSDKMLFDGRYKLMYGDLRLDRRAEFKEPPYNGPAFGRPVNLPPDRIALYDLYEDPREECNLANDPQKTQLLADMKEKLLQRIIRNMQAAPEDSGSVM